MADDFKSVDKWIQDSSHKTIDKLKRCLVAGGNAIQGKARQKVAVNTGHLRESIISTANFNKGDLEVIIGTTLAYGAYIEFGTLPHKSSEGHKEFVEGIKRWCFLHNIKNWYPVYLKIVKEGTYQNRTPKGRPYLIPAYNEVAPKVDAKLEQILQETGN